MANLEKKRLKVQEQIRELDKTYALTLQKKTHNGAEITPATYMKRREELAKRLQELK